MNVGVPESTNEEKDDEEVRNPTDTFGASLRGPFRSGAVRFGRAENSNYPRKSGPNAKVPRLLSVLLGCEGRKDLAGDRQMEF